METYKLYVKQYRRHRLRYAGRGVKMREIADMNLFMMCEELNESALSELPEGFFIRTCRKEELAVWRGFPFDTEKEKKEYDGFMREYYQNVYRPAGEEFFRKCLFVCEKETDLPVATCFLWKSYDRFQTVHWFKTLKNYEGQGIGRALLSHLLKNLPKEEFPVFLHTQPESFRAIGLYADFGFRMVTNHRIGYRENHYRECMDFLRQSMKEEAFRKLQFVQAPAYFDEAAKSSEISQF